MRKFYIIGFLFLMLFDTIGQISFKMTANSAQPLEANWLWLFRVFTEPWVFIAICGYIGAFFTWMTLLRRAPVGPAFAASHLEVVTVMIGSVLLFGEKISFSHLVGAAFIIGGIIFLAFAERDELEKQKKDQLVL